MTVAHSTLTGSDLHEPKGVAAATVDKVYISNGSASGAWTSYKTGSFNPLAYALLHVQDQKASGTAGGTFTASGVWRTRTVNTVIVNEISGASLGSNQITVGAGTFYLQAFGVARKVDTHVLKIRNITAGTDFTGLIGIPVYSATDTNSSGLAEVSGRFTVAGSTVIELQHRCTTTNASDGFGSAAGFGVVEVYADVKIWKLY